MTDLNLKRKPIHRRQVNCQGYLREDGLWDIEAILVDTKSYQFATIERGLLEPNAPVHDMWICLTLDETLTIKDIDVKTKAAPFKLCQKVPPRFKNLIGIQIGKGWMSRVNQTLETTESCTHLTEMLRVMATAAFQTIHPYRMQQTNGAKIVHPSVIDTCQGFASDGEVVQTYFPELAKN